MAPARPKSAKHQKPMRPSGAPYSRQAVQKMDDPKRCKVKPYATKFENQPAYKLPEVGIDNVCKESKLSPTSERDHPQWGQQPCHRQRANGKNSKNTNLSQNIDTGRTTSPTRVQRIPTRKGKGTLTTKTPGEGWRLNEEPL